MNLRFTYRILIAFIVAIATAITALAQTATPTPDDTAEPPSERALLQAALDYAGIFGTMDALSVDDIDPAQIIYMTDAELNAADGQITAERALIRMARGRARPLLIVSLTGSNIRPFGGGTVPPEERVEFNAIVVMVYADTGEVWSMAFVPEDRTIPDYAAKLAEAMANVPQPEVTPEVSQPSPDAD
jgi:hypothetical protein